MIYFSKDLSLPDGVDQPRFFSRFSDTQITRGKLPHWEQRSVATFVTFRLADSLPQRELDQLRGEQSEWLAGHPQPWNDDAQREHDELFSARIEGWLDAGYGDCILRDPENRGIVEDRLRYFDGVKYRLYAFVVMPNHVHVVFMPYDDVKVVDVVRTWKSVSSKMIVKRLARKGAIWMPEYFDRAIRNGEHFERAVRYTLRNDERLAWSVFGT